MLGVPVFIFQISLRKKYVRRTLNRVASDLVSVLFLALKWSQRKVHAPEFMQFKGPVLKFGLSIILREYMTGGFVLLQSEEKPGTCARSG